MRSSRLGSVRAVGWQPPSAEKVARFFPQHEILEMIGHGGMGAVYKARQITLDRVAAVKLLPLEVSADANYAARFRREAQSMAKLSHPNVVGIYDFGQTPAGYLYISMEYVDGAMLHDFIHAGDLTVEQNLYIFSQVCDALAYAHSKGVVHRDVKPGNVLVDRLLRSKVCDFGLARGLDGKGTMSGATMTGIVMGTPDYMSPEQKRGGTVDHRADIYSLGVMLYEMLCREIPQGIFEPASKRVGSDPRLDQIIMRAMQQKPEKRFQSALEMKAALENARYPIVRAVQRQPVHSAQGKPRQHARPTPLPAKQNNHSALVWAGVAMAVVIGGVGLFAIRSGGKKVATRLATPASARKQPRAATPPAIPPRVAGPILSELEPADTMDPAKGFPIDLLIRVNPDEDTVAGTWKRTADGLTGEPKDGEKFAVILPYRAPTQFDFLVEFTVPEDAQVAQFFPVPGGMAAWKVNAQWGDDRFDGLDLLDGKFVNQRSEASRRRPEPLAAGRHTSELRIRRNHIAVLLDGEEVLDWSGPLKRLSLEPSSQFPEYDKLALGGWARGVIFHKVEVREAGAKGSVLRKAVDLARLEINPAPPTPAAATPAPATPAPQSEVAKWLTGVDAQFQEQYRREVSAPFEATATKLREQYLTSLDTSITSLSRANRLEEALVLRDERVRVAGGQQPHDAADDANTSVALKQLRESWRRAFAKADAERFARAKSVHSRYDSALAQNQAALTQRQRFDDALLLKTKREEITSTWLTPPIDFIKPASTPVPPPAPGS